MGSKLGPLIFGNSHSRRYVPTLGLAADVPLRGVSPGGDTCIVAID